MSVLTTNNDGMLMVETAMEEPARVLTIDKMVEAPVRIVAEGEIARRCDVCKEAIGDGDFYHQPHDDGCPNQRFERNLYDDDGSGRVDCDCDNAVHEACCPVCAPHIVVQHRRLVLWYWSGTRAGWVGKAEQAHHYADKRAAERVRDRLVREGRYNSLNQVESVPVPVAEKLRTRLESALAAMAAR